MYSASPTDRFLQTRDPMDPRVQLTPTSRSSVSRIAFSAELLFGLVKRDDAKAHIFGPAGTPPAGGAHQSGRGDFGPACDSR